MKKFYCFIFLICTAFGAVDRYQHQQDLERANLEMLIERAANLEMLIERAANLEMPIERAANLEMLIFEGLPQTQVIPNVFGILASLMSFSLTRFVDNDLIPTEARIRDEFSHCINLISNIINDNESSKIAILGSIHPILPLLFIIRNIDPEYYEDY